MSPLVSFVVPCYKLAHLLPGCINSILAQTYRDFEVLIMDNCSPDKTPEVAASFKEPRVKHIRNETNLGHVRNFNKGITMARGKYVWLVSPDDWLGDAEILGRYVQLMEKKPGVAYVFCRPMEVHGSGTVGVAQWPYFGKTERIWDGRDFLLQLIQANRVPLSSAMVRKECYDKVGLFSLEMPHANDWYLWCMLALHYRVAYLPQPMVFVRIHEESLTTAFNRSGSPICILDELNVLWRVARQAELEGVISNRRAFNTCIASRAARALKSGPAGGARPGLSEEEFDALLRRFARDPEDEEDMRVRVCFALGDEQFWNANYDKAAESYWLGLKQRPWWIRSWVKYLLLRTGRIGLGIRRLILDLREPRLGQVR